MDFTTLAPDEIRELLIAKMQNPESRGGSLNDFRDAFYASVPEAKGIITHLHNGTELTSAQVSLLSTLGSWQVIMLWMEATNVPSRPEGPALEILRRAHKVLASYVVQAFSTSPAMKRLFPASQPAPSAPAGEKPGDRKVEQSE